MPRAIKLAAVLLAAATAGCGSDRATRGEGTLEVVATTQPVADIVRNAGGRRVRVRALVPRAQDPHGFRPRAAHRDAARGADLLVSGGGRIDSWAAGLGAPRTLTLLELVDPLGGDPHWWQDPLRVERAAKEIRNELARADVDGAGYYEAAAADFMARVRRLDRGIRRCIAEIPAGRRDLATQHDGFAYFEARYAVSIGAPSRGVKVGRRLWADTLGPAGSPAASYLGAMSENTAAIVDALSGGRRSCRPRP